MIVEVRTYKVKAGVRDRFITFFENRAVPAQRAHGMTVVRPFLDSKTPTSSSGYGRFHRWKNVTG